MSLKGSTRILVKPPLGKFWLGKSRLSESYFIMFCILSIGFTVFDSDNHHWAGEVLYVICLTYFIF